jgi:hypothetical protein
VRGRGVMPQSASRPIRGYFATTPSGVVHDFTLGNFAGSQQCGGGSCWTEFNWYKLRNGTTVDAGIHVPN